MLPSVRSGSPFIGFAMVMMPVVPVIAVVGVGAIIRIAVPLRIGIPIIIIIIPVSSVIAKFKIDAVEV